MNLGAGNLKERGFARHRLIDLNGLKALRYREAAVVLADPARDAGELRRDDRLLFRELRELHLHVDACVVVAPDEQGLCRLKT